MSTMNVRNEWNSGILFPVIIIVTYFHQTFLHTGFFEIFEDREEIVFHGFEMYTIYILN